VEHRLTLAPVHDSNSDKSSEAIRGGPAQRVPQAGARALLETVLVDEPSHPGAREILRDLERGWKS